MPRPRTPLSKARATGQDVIHATRFNKRKEPAFTGPLGPPPHWLKGKEQIEAWKAFCDEIPWLQKSHRCLTAIACIARAELASGCADTKKLNLLRQCLSSMGATPSDASKITLPNEGEPEDPSAKYFQ